MTCDTARDWLFAGHDGLLSAAERAELRAHRRDCPACAAEAAELSETYAVIGRELRAITDPIAPSAAFWAGLSAGLDAIDVERRVEARAAGRRASPPRRNLLIRRWAAASALAAALLGAAFGTGGLQEAWASLQHRLTFLATFGIGQVEPTALVGGPAATGDTQLRLTVRELVSGRRVTLLAYEVRGRALTAPSTNPPVADGVDASLIDDRGHRYLPTYWLPAHRGSDRGIPIVRGLLAFPPLPQQTRRVRLVAKRLPLAQPAAGPWSIAITLRAADAHAEVTSMPIDAAALRQGIRIAVTYLTRTTDATILDLAGSVVDGPLAGGTVVSLDPDQANGEMAPTLRIGGSVLYPDPPALPAPVRQQALPGPEFGFGPPRPSGGTATLRLASVAVRLPASAAAILPIASGATRAVSLGPTGTVTLGTAPSTPPPGLGLEGVRQLRIAVRFPPPGPHGTLERLTLQLSGVYRIVSRDDPALTIAWTGRAGAVRVIISDPVIVVRGPWTIPLQLR